MKKQLCSSALLLLATQATASTPATVAYVDAADDQIITEIENKGGIVDQLQCQQNNPPPSSNATVAYVDACDDELNSAINSIPTVSPFAVGDMLCGDSYPWSCPATNPEPWGIVIYLDPNPTVSGYYGLTMSVKDVVAGFYDGSSNPPGKPWANATLTNTEIYANNYGIYGGINGTFKNDLGEETDGNTQIFCNNTDNPQNDCATTDATSAFNACVQYSNGPSLAGGWYLPSFSEVALMFTYAQTIQYPHPAPTGMEQFSSYYYWSSTEWSGSEEAFNHGQMSYTQDPGDAGSIALVFYFVNGYQSTESKGMMGIAVRCVQALPI